MTCNERYNQCAIPQRHQIRMTNHIRAIQQIKTWNWDRISWIVAIEIAIAMVIACFFLPGGEDLYRYYQPFAQGCSNCGFIPYFSHWLLWPLGLVPYPFAWPAWTAVSLAGWLGICRITKVNPALTLLTFPAFGQVWLGQIDVFIAAGLALALLAKNPYARGAGIMLAMIKPQFSAIPVLYLLITERERLKVLVVPAVVVAASLVIYGIDWPLDWLANASTELPVHHWRMAAMDVWPFGLMLIWLPLIFRDRQQGFTAALLITTLATPFVSVYSYLVFLVLARHRWWVIPLSHVWLLAYPPWSHQAMRLAWVLPAALLAQMVYRQFRNHFIRPIDDAAAPA